MVNSVCGGAVLFFSRINNSILICIVSTQGAGSGAGSGAGAGHGSMQMWKNITLFVAAPAIVLAMVNAYIGEMEHWSHPRYIEFQAWR